MREYQLCDRSDYRAYTIVCNNQYEFQHVQDIACEYGIPHIPSHYKLEVDFNSFSSQQYVAEQLNKDHAVNGLTIKIGG